jgi:hypothetical protein
MKEMRFVDFLEKCKIDVSIFATKTLNVRL